MEKFISYFPWLPPITRKEINISKLQLLICVSVIEKGYNILDGRAAPVGEEELVTFPRLLLPNCFVFFGYYLWLLFSIPYLFRGG